MWSPSSLFQILLLVASLSQAQAQAQEDSIVECSAELLQDFDFTMDGFIGQVEFIQILEELAPVEASCDVASTWQSKNVFQTALKDLSCICTDYTTGDDSRCRCGDDHTAFALPGTFNNADYDTAVCQHIVRAIHSECGQPQQAQQEQQAEEVEELQVVPPVLAPPSNLRASYTASSSSATPTYSLVGAVLSLVTVLTLCVLVVLQVLQPKSDNDKQLPLIAADACLLPSSSIIQPTSNSNTPYLQVV